jgi:hypothetical protein
MKVMLKDVRLAFPNLFKAKAVEEGGEPRYGATFLLAPDHPAIAELKRVMLTVAEEKWGAKAAEIAKSLFAGGRIALRNGDSKSEYEGFAGNMFISASNKAKPTVLDNKADPSTGRPAPLTQVDGRPYAGCYVNALVDIWAQDNSFGKRINASLMGVQFVRDGDPFAGGGVASDSDFAAVEGADASTTADDVFGS